MESEHLASIVIVVAVIRIINRNYTNISKHNEISTMLIEREEIHNQY
ncbi:hypothetical protein LXL04_028238 [Taraxacum kok-saghyz]